VNELERWVSHVAKETRPARLQWWDGSGRALRDLERQLESEGRLLALDGPRSRMWRQRPRPAGGEGVRVLVSDAGSVRIDPRQEVVSRATATRTLGPLMRGAMQGRSMYVVP
jgi:GTP-dependent phosphoenolpyruvate carboxykinase